MSDPGHDLRCAICAHFCLILPHFCLTTSASLLPRFCLSDADCFANRILGVAELAEKAEVPLLITEYNNGLGETSRDDSSAAAFVLRQIALLEGKLEAFSWWTFSDVFEEGWMASEPFHNGFGMMTMQGTRKPVWRAFEMLMGAGAKRLPV